MRFSKVLAKVLSPESLLKPSLLPLRLPLALLIDINHTSSDDLRLS